MKRVENVLENDRVVTKYIEVDNFTGNGLYLVKNGSGYDMCEYISGECIERDYDYFCIKFDEDEVNLYKILDREEKINYFLK